MRIRALRTSGLALLLLALSTSIQQAQGQEDCFNDDHRLSHNDLEPPMTPTPALTVSDQDIAPVLASINEPERPVDSARAYRDPRDNGQISPMDGSMKP